MKGNFCKKRLPAPWVRITRQNHRASKSHSFIRAACKKGLLCKKIDPSHAGEERPTQHSQFPAERFHWIPLGVDEASDGDWSDRAL